MLKGRNGPAMSEYRHARVKVADLIPAENNSRNHSKAQIQQLIRSMEQFGFTNPVLIDDGKGLIAGHARLRAAAEIGLTEIPAIVLSGLSEDQKRAYIIADNRLALDASWDDEMLLQELSALEEADFPLSDIGMTDDEVRSILESRESGGLTDVDEVPEVAEASPVSAFGDAWLLGDNGILVCGDSTDPGVYDYFPRVDCIWTDPPYAVNKPGVSNDDLNPADFVAMLKSAFGLAFDKVAPGCPIYVCCAGRTLHHTAAGLESAGFYYSTQLVWVKSSLVMGWGDYQWKHENILYGWKPREKGGKNRWRGGRRQSTVRSLDDSPITQISKNEWQITVGNTVYSITGGKVDIQGIAPTVMYADKPKSAEGHPTMKPVELIREMLLNSAGKGDVILDPFAGSGSTAIAAEWCGMGFAMVELDPGYCDLAIERWQNYTGGVATLAATDEPYASVKARLTETGGGLCGHRA